MCSRFFDTDNEINSVFFYLNIYLLEGKRDWRKDLGKTVFGRMEVCKCQ